jgi:hypothetical protein
MLVVASLENHLIFHPPWRAGVRIRYGLPKIRRVRFRRVRRARLWVTVQTTIGGHTAMLASVMLYGACLHGGRRLRRCEVIAIKLPSGARIKARVCWRLGQRCGVKFLSPIADFARLISERGVIRPPLRHRLRAIDPPLGWIEGPRATRLQPRRRYDDRSRLWSCVVAAVRAVGDRLFSRRPPARNAPVAEPVTRCRAIEDVGFLPPLP